jgi:Cu/Ag efflux protein CusF
MKNFKLLLVLVAMLVGSVQAQNTINTGGAKNEASASSAEMSDGEIRKVDMDNKKITIKHGDIKNLDMPGMTMVFQVKDPALLDKAKPGDKVRFRAEKANGAIVVTDIQPVK